MSDHRPSRRPGLARRGRSLRPCPSFVSRASSSASSIAEPPGRRGSNRSLVRCPRSKSSKRARRRREGSRPVPRASSIVKLALARQGDPKRQGHLQRKAEDRRQRASRRRTRAGPRRRPARRAGRRGGRARSSRHCPAVRRASLSDSRAPAAAGSHFPRSSRNRHNPEAARARASSPLGPSKSEDG